MGRMSAWEGRHYSTAMISSSKSETSDSRDYGTEVGRLRADNEALAEELQQCQADKDFVWSLWRKLQVANPDITQAVGMVVQREKEKSELKDRKVLEILQIKDDKIEELHAMLSKQGREMEDLQSKKVEHQGDVITLRTENSALLEKLAQFEDQTRSMKTREQNMDGYHRQVINEMQGEKEVLQKQLLQQQRRVESLESQTEQLRAELKTSMVQRDTLQGQVQGFQRDIATKVSQFEQLVKDLENARHLVQKHETQNRQNLLEIEEKCRELETVRRELSELWSSHHQLNEHATQQAELIRQLQSLQLDTQKMLKNQEDAYSIEATSLQQMYAELTTRYDVSKKAESEQRKEILTLKKQLFERDDTIVQLQHKLDLAHIDNRVHRDEHESFIGMEKDQCENLRTRIDSLLTEIHLLKETIVQKDKIIEDMDNRLDNQTFKFNVDHLKERSHSTPIRKEYRSVALSPLRARSRSPSPTTLTSSAPTSSGSPRSSSRPSSSPAMSAFTEDMRRMSSMAEAKVGELKTLLKLKCDELKDVRVAHDRRLNRLKSIQTNYRLIKEQLKTFEEEQAGSKKNKKLRRSHPRDLQKEDSDSVWNELAYFKNEAKTLQTQNLKLEEENDVLRVETSQAAATIHELRMALEQEKEELEYQLQKRDLQRTEEENSHLSDVRKQLSDKDIKLDSCRRELEQCQNELREKTNLQEKLLDERRVLRAELTEQKQSASSYRIEIASMKREMDRLEKQLERGKMLLRREVAAARSGANIARIGRNKRSRRLNAPKLIPPNVSSSTEKTSSVCEEPNEEDWEEISSETEETLTESDGLGHAIVRAAKSLVSVPSSSTLTSDSMHSLRAKVKQKKLGHLIVPNKCSQRVSVGRKEASYPRGTQTKVYRDASTSPVTHFTSPAVRQSPSLRSVSRKTKPLQQRVDSLQQQLTVLRDSRATALKVVSELKQTNEQLQADLGLANQRLRMARQNVQKLSSDYERVNRERDELESRLIGESTETKHSEHGWKALENRLKSASNEVTRQAGVIKVLKTENEAMTDQIKTLQDRLNRAERDNTQKRSLLEDQKSRLKQAKESVHSEASLISDLEARIDQLTTANDKMKIQMESGKRRVSVLTKERREHEQRFIKLTAELDKKNKQLAEAQCKRDELEVALSEVETTAQDQLHGLATQSEAAIDIAQHQLRATHAKLLNFQKFVKTLLHEVCVRCQQARSLSKQYCHNAERAKPPESRSLLKAQSVARDILNISQSDLEDIMSVDLEQEHWETEIEDEKKKDKKWSKKCERLMSSQEDFVLPLVELIMEKMEEREELVHRLHTS